MEKCTNCSTTLESRFVYCPSCGQSAHTHRFNLPHVFHEVFHALTHADKGVLYLLKELAIHPGVVAREYVLEGKRKKYFNPFTFLVLAVGVVVFVNSVFHPYTHDQTAAEAAATRQYESAEQRQREMGFYERRKNFQTFLEKRGNLVAFLSIPIVAFMYWLFFLRTGIDYAEHLVAHVFFTGFYVLLMSIVLTPLQQILPNGRLYDMIPLLVHLGYLIFAYYQFLDQRVSLKLLKSTGAAFLALTFWTIVSVGGGWLYISYG